MGFTITKEQKQRHPTRRSVKGENSLAKHRRNSEPLSPTPPPHVFTVQNYAKLPSIAGNLTEAEQEIFTETVNNSTFATVPSYEKLQHLCIEVFEKIPEGGKGIICYLIVEFGKLHGLSDAAAQGATLDGFNMFLEKLEMQRRADPVFIAMEKARQDYAAGMSLKHIAYRSALQDIPAEDIHKLLHDHRGMYSQNEHERNDLRKKQAEIDEGYNSIKNKFSYTPGAGVIAETPTPAALKKVAADQIAAGSQYMEVALFDRLVNMLIDTEAGNGLIPEPKYISQIENEKIKIKETPSAAQLAESVRHIGTVSGQGIRLDVIVELSAVLQRAQKSD